MTLRFLWIYLGMLLSAQGQETPLREAWAKPELELAMVSKSPGVLDLHKAKATGAVRVPSGTVCVTEAGKDRCLVLKTTLAAEIATSIPVATLSGSLPEGTKWRPSEETISELAPLVQYLETKPATSLEALRLTALCLMSDPTFRQWNALSSDSAEAKVAAALDAVTLLREIAPGKSFALQEDGELKLAAYRTPGLRGKAMQAFQVKISPVPVNPKSLPNMEQLMHIAPGDDCPLCRIRGKAAGVQDNL